MTSKEEIAFTKIEIAARIISSMACNPQIDLSSPTWANIAADNAEAIVERFLEKKPKPKIKAVGTKDAD